MKKVPIFRIIASLAAVLLFAFGIYCFLGAWQMRNEFYKQKDKILFDIEVDLSAPNKYTIPFEQTWDICHAQTVELYIPTDTISNISQENLLKELNFTWQIINTEGEVAAKGLSSDNWLIYDSSDEQSIMLIYFHPIRKGHYKFVLNILEGDPSLYGLEQRLNAQYQPCGLELTLAFVVLIVGFISVLAAIIIALIVILVTKRRQRIFTKITDVNI